MQIMNMKSISCEGEKGMAGIPSSGATSFSSACADDVECVFCRVASISSELSFDWLLPPFAECDDSEAVGAMSIDRGLRSAMAQWCNDCRCNGLAMWARAQQSRWWSTVLTFLVLSKHDPCGREGRHDRRL